MTAATVELERNGAIASVIINRPERRNAITGDMMVRLEELSRAFAQDEETRAVIFRSEGSDFSVGADLSQSPSSRSSETSLLMRRRVAETGSLLMRAIQEIHQPTICAMKGVATGAGACISAACDFRIGADTTRAGYGEVKLGINLMWNAVPVCVHLVGPARAKRMIMTGKLFDAITLERWGFLDEVVPLAELDNRTEEWAQEYATLPPISVQMIKRSINHVSGALNRAVMHMDGDQWLLATMSDDYREAVSAFFEKRTPVFRGR